MKTRFKKRFLYISTSDVSLRPSFIYVYVLLPHTKNETETNNFCVRE